MAYNLILTRSDLLHTLKFTNKKKGLADWTLGMPSCLPVQVQKSSPYSASP
jgi:hypothetical protein